MNAAAIGESLCASVIEEGGFATWVGRTLAEVDNGAPTVASLEAGLYDGTAGVGLFLAELAVYSGSERVADVACAALRRSLSLAPRAASLWNGRAGIGLAAWRTGRILGDSRLLRRGRACVLDAGPVERLDLMDGAAGVALAQLCVGEPERAARTLAPALAGARRENDVAWWDNEALCGGEVGPLPLLGLSHGASGVGAALFALAEATGATEPLDLALASVRFEARWRRDDNWPDLRDQRADLRPADAPNRMVAWCHGAAGVALARALALRVAPSPALREDRDAALRAVERALRTPRDTSLCHGLGGLSEALVVSGDPARLALARRAWRRPPLRSGLPSGAPNPALMVGLAGVGHALLRLEAAAAPVLLPDPAAWR